MAHETSDAQFTHDVLEADKPVLVDFWAAWCGPCRQIAPVIDEIATEMESKIKVVKVNVEQNTAIPTQYGVRGIPTLMLFNQGQVVATRVGSLSKAALQEWIQSSIAS